MQRRMKAWREIQPRKSSRCFVVRKSVPILPLNGNTLFCPICIAIIGSVFHRFAASCISRIFRGHMGRREASKANRGKMRKERMAVFHYHALLVQKYFRGFYSRRYYHDFFARKAYIQSVVVKSNALREKLAAQLEQQRRVSSLQIFVYVFSLLLGRKKKRKKLRRTMKSLRKSHKTCTTLLAPQPLQASTSPLICNRR